MIIPEMPTEGFDEENIEEPKWHFFYFNNEISDHPVVLECIAGSQAEADDIFTQKMGKKPNKDNHIGCTTIKI